MRRWRWRGLFREAPAVIASEAKQSSRAPAGALRKASAALAVGSAAFSGALTRAAGLLRRFASRNDGGGASRASSIVKQPDAHQQTCVIAPCSLRPQGKPSFLFLVSRKGAC